MNILDIYENNDVIFVDPRISTRFEIHKLKMEKNNPIIIWEWDKVDQWYNEQIKTTMISGYEMDRDELRYYDTESRIVQNGKISTVEEFNRRFKKSIDDMIIFLGLNARLNSIIPMITLQQKRTKDYFCGFTTVSIGEQERFQCDYMYTSSITETLFQTGYLLYDECFKQISKGGKMKIPVIMQKIKSMMEPMQVFCAFTLKKLDGSQHNMYHYDRKESLVCDKFEWNDIIHYVCCYKLYFESNPYCKPITDYVKGILTTNIKEI